MAPGFFALLIVCSQKVETNLGRFKAAKAYSFLSGSSSAIYIAYNIGGITF